MSTTPSATPNANQLSPEQIAEQIATQTAPAATTPTPEPLERDFSVVLDTGQTYKGKTKDEVIQQLVKAQENASRRIKELSDQQQQVVQPQQVQQVAQQEPQFDQNKYYQLLASDPIAANDYYLDFSPKARAINEQMGQLQSMREEIAARTEFITFQNSVPDFDFNNQDAINKFDAEFPKLGLPWTAQNLILAHNHFVRSGVYEAKPAETVQTQTARPQAMPTLTGQTAGSVPQKDPNQMTTQELESYIKSLNGQ